jgi:hypothetical protein
LQASTRHMSVNRFDMQIEAGDTHAIGRAEVELQMLVGGLELIAVSLQIG